MLAWRNGNIKKTVSVMVHKGMSSSYRLVTILGFDLAWFSSHHPSASVSSIFIMLHVFLLHLFSLHFGELSLVGLTEMTYNIYLYLSKNDSNQTNRKEQKN